MKCTDFIVMRDDLQQGKFVPTQLPTWRRCPTARCWSKSIASLSPPTSSKE
jgi:hypothetical protein